MRTIEPKEIEERFEKIMTDREFILLEFATLIGLSAPQRILSDISSVIDELDHWFKPQVIDLESENTAGAAVGLIIGDYFLQKYHGEYYPMTTPNNKLYGHILVGKFSSVKTRIAFDPWLVAKDYLKEEPGRELKRYFKELDEMIAMAVNNGY